MYDDVLFILQSSKLGSHVREHVGYIVGHDLLGVSLWMECQKHLERLEMVVHAQVLREGHGRKVGR